jgi:peptide chain release factor 1
MKESLYSKLETLCRRHAEVGQLMSTSDVMNDQNKIRDLGKEYAELSPLAEQFTIYKSIQIAITDAEEMLAQDDDLEMQQMAKEELKRLKAQQEELSEELKMLLLPKDPNDDKNIFLEIRAGTGGDEAAIFAGDLFRMYSRFAEVKRWQLEIVSASDAEHGGYKEIITRVIGQDVYSHLKFESGAHRVQRVPVTESQGRVHTSACTVAVLPEADEISAVEINSKDLRVDTFRASGAGGQHVNKTDSAIRLTHLPTGIVVECQDERSQHKNRAKAMSLLSARILRAKQEAQQKDQAQTRKLLVGSGDRSERIRTYNYPQGRITDHRINLTLYQLDDVMEGDLSPVIDPLIRELKAQQLTELSDG